MNQKMQDCLVRTTQWFKEDRYRMAILLGGFVYGWLLTQGIPLWDDDFTSWYDKIKDQSIFTYLIEWVSPISTQPQYWGFNERPLQSLAYKFFYLIAGYESWAYVLFRAIVYGGLGLAIYAWSQRLMPGDTRGSTYGRRAALAVAILFLAAPGTFAAHLILSDFAPIAELLFLVLTYWIWKFVEETPVEWSGMPKFSDPAHKAWIKRWAILAFLTYLGYKSKADLKLIPAILAIYVLCVRRHQWKFFAIPVGIMGLLALPWGKAIFTKLPPFMPGSQGSEIGWMWQPASFDRFKEFLWSSYPYSFWGSWNSANMSLSAVWGPFMLVGLIIYLFWRSVGLDQVKWGAKEQPQDRARIFAMIWFVILLVGISSLPALNYSFRVRYGILPLVPGSLLLAWAFGLFAQSIQERFARGARVIPEKFHRPLVYLAIALVAFQGLINVSRSVEYRRSMGQVMIGVDQAYEHVKNNNPDGKLALLPDFRPYNYRPDSGKAFVEKTWLGSNEEIRQHPVGTMVISWNPTLWEELELVQHFTGCRSTAIFDLVFPCPRGTGSYLMKYIGRDPLFVEAEAARGRGDAANALRLHTEFQQKHPGSLASRFSAALAAFQVRDFARADAENGELEKYFPNHGSILYNRALAQVELQKYDAAIERFQRVISMDPKSYGSWLNLYYTQVKAGHAKKAARTLKTMRETFPGDAEVERLSSAAAQK